MDNIIIKYQKAYNKIIEELKNNGKILAVMVFGSMVSGDLWDESDIDLFVIKEGQELEMENIYTEYYGVPIHVKLMSKQKFLQLNDSNFRGGFLHRVFASSKLVFSKDFDITNIYNRGRYFSDIDKDKWNMVYLGDLLKDLGVCKKYIQNEKIYTSYALSIRCIESYSRLYVNNSGYMVNKDTISLAMNLNNDFKHHVDKIFFSCDKDSEVIKDLVKYIEDNLKEVLKSSASLLLDYMKSKDKVLSATDIKTDKLFQGYDINIEEILKELWKNNYIKRQYRDYKSEDGDVILKENVYYI